VVCSHEEHEGHEGRAEGSNTDVLDRMTEVFRTDLANSVNSVRFLRPCALWRKEKSFRRGPRCNGREATARLSNPHASRVRSPIRCNGGEALTSVEPLTPSAGYES
jgi:hypothetical protein